MAKKEDKRNSSHEEEIITSSGSGIANVAPGQRGSRGVRGAGNNNQNNESQEVITSSGSGIANVAPGQRGSRGVRGAGNNNQNNEPQEVITSSGSGIANVAPGQRGSRGVKGAGNNNQNNEPQEVITSSGSGIANVAPGQRGSRGVRGAGNNNQNNAPQEVITSSGSGIANVAPGQRGSRGVKGAGNNNQNNASQEKITSSGSGIANVAPGQRGSRGVRGAGMSNNNEQEKVTSSGSGIAPIATVRGSKAIRQEPVIIPEAELKSEYELNGKVYKTVKLISATTAEARIILVERNGEKFALKLYYSHIPHRPDTEVLGIVKKQAKVKQDFIIKLFDYGVWVNPEDEDEESDFELMEYCEGGSLIPGSLHGDEEELVRVTTAMMKSAFYCSKIGILHRDIKPANFLWVDKEHTKLVLADFGFAIPCPEGESVQVNDDRTKMYTAPEFYHHVRESLAKVGAPSDVYSVGLSMLTMWSGEEVLMGKTEDDLIKDKTYERLKYPTDLQPRVLQLMKGLTRSNLDYRWDLQKLISWSKGELDSELKEDEGKTSTIGNLKIVFDSRNNIVAHNCEELAHLMVKYQDLAIRYLYKGNIEDWLKKAEMDDLSEWVHEIVEEIYPKKNQYQAGLWSVIYLLDSKTPYYFPETDFSMPEETWLSAENTEDLAVVIYNKLLHEKSDDFRASFLKELTSYHSRLEIFLEGKKKVPVLKHARKLIRDNYIKFIGEEEALLLLIYSLNRDLPYPINGEYAENIEDIQAIAEKYNRADTLVATDAFVEWLLNRNPALAVKAKKIIEKRRNEGPAVVYGIFPEMGYDFKINPDDPDRVFTVKQLGRYLNDSLFKDLYSGSEGRYYMDDYFWSTFYLRQDERVGIYLESKKKYDDFIPFIQSCVKWKDINKGKYGPENNYYALFKLIKGLGFDPYYEFKDGTRVTTLEELNAVPLQQKREALDKYMLAEWIASFFQEDPKRNMKEKYTYENLMTGFIEYIGQIDPDYAPYKRYKSALKKIYRAQAKAQAADRKQNIIKYGLIPLALLMFLAVILVTIIYGIPNYNPIDGRYWGISIVICVVVALTMLIKDGNLIGGILWGVLAGFGGTLGLAYLFDFISPWFTWVYAGIVLAAAIACFIMMKNVMNQVSINPNEPNPKNPQFQFKELEALHYAYVEKSDNFNSTIEKYADRYVKNSGNDVGEKLGRVFGSMGVAIVLGAGAYFLIPRLSGDLCIGYAAMNPGPKLKGDYNGLVDESTECTFLLDSISGLHVDSAVMKVKKAIMPLSGSITRKKDRVYTLDLKPMEGSDTLSKWYGTYKLDFNIKDNTGSGTFIPLIPDENGEVKPMQLKFKQGEIEVAAKEQPEEKKASGSSKKKKSTSSKKSSSASTVDPATDNATEATAPATSDEAAQEKGTIANPEAAVKEEKAAVTEKKPATEEKKEEKKDEKKTEKKKSDPATRPAFKWK